jgi:N-acetylmuramoyl-L-alanine amidase
LSLVRLRDRPSPHHDERPAGATVDTIVLHATDAAGNTADRFSAHYTVDTDGAAWRAVPDARRAWHAGVSQWRGRPAVDDRSIGILLVRARGRDFPVLQLASVCDLCLEIIGRHRVPSRNIVGHSDIAPERASDPGETFDWAALAREGVGIWPDGAPDPGTGGMVRDAAALRDVRAALTAVGYRVAPEGALDPALSAVLRAFQRHWRPEAVTGQADAGTLARLLAVARLCTA